MSPNQWSTVNVSQKQQNHTFFTHGLLIVTDNLHSAAPTAIHIQLALFITNFTAIYVKPFSNIKTLQYLSFAYIFKGQLIENLEMSGILAAVREMGFY